MLKLEDLKKDCLVKGIDAGSAVKIVSTEFAGENAVAVIYKDDRGRLGERMLFRSDEGGLTVAEGDSIPWTLDAPGGAFKLAVEALRIHLAHLFDPMMAIHTSAVDPLPHQITAVYESMLPRQPLRFVLADDPGSGKTIMAGLYIRELMMRADGQRILIVAPGSLVEQWQDELREKFGLDFEILTREKMETSASGNFFMDKDRLIARLDQLSRAEDFQEKLQAVEWDLVVVDEAHKMSASYFGNKINATKRFKLGELLSGTERTRHFLMMTATPHNGKEEDFQLFLSLLDGDRFYGKFRDGVHKVDVSDVMRRMVKEELLKFDGTRLFPERCAYTVNYDLSSVELALYEAVTDYVKNEMNKADRLDGQHKGTVGFALTILQRRLASSPEAIYQSLKRRRKRLEQRVEEEKSRHRGNCVAETMATYAAAEAYEDIDDELTGEEYEALTDRLVDQATAAVNVHELAAEIEILKKLEHQAKQVVNSGQNRKWDELSRILQDDPHTRAPGGHRRKLIIFTEHKDTLNYLCERIAGVLGDKAAVAVIHGGVHRDERRRVQEMFRHDPTVLVLVATDAAGEGVNLQNANLMINYDLPWNPNRIEQRFGRIHRIGQTEVCHLWNLVAKQTREGDVFFRLLEKLEIERKALGGRVYDILGDAFDNRSLKDMLIEAIRYGEDPVVRARLEQEVAGALDTEHLKALLARNALSEEVMTPERLYAVKEEMEKAEARKLQPYFIRGFFREAFANLHGILRPREEGRYEITHVPGMIRERDRRISHSRTPVLQRYDRICFERQYIHMYGKPMAGLVHPGHPIMAAVTDLVLEAHRPKLRQGTMLLHPADAGTVPRLLVLLDHSVRESVHGHNQRQVASRRLQFVFICPDGTVTHAGWAPHLDLEPLTEEEAALVKSKQVGQWLNGKLEALAIAYAANTLVPEHYEEVKARRQKEIEKVRQAVHERLTKEIDYWQERYLQLKDALAAGKQPRMQPENARRRVEELRARLDVRTKELESRGHLISSPPMVAGAALVIPAGLMAQCRNQALPPSFGADVQRKKVIERLAMLSVLETERRQGYTTRDVSGDKCGWDISAFKPGAPDRHIEVKGRAKGIDTITVSRNEILYGLNQEEKFRLAIVLVDENDRVEGPYYIRRPFNQEPDWGVASSNYDLAKLLAKAQAYC
jgi:superfamily II DNA or RNA helicase